jgi:hypothetical protein
MVKPHGGDLRGRALAPASSLYTGPFGRMFRALPPADFGETDEQSKAALMELGKMMSALPDPPKDAADPEESGIPALYTYLGQFIDHDLTFDPASSLEKQNDPDALVDFRTPRFDLDNVYGRGPDDQPYFYRSVAGFAAPKFILGSPMTGAGPAFDLPRSSGSKPFDKRAIIGDPRNDENVLVSQLQGLFHRFHNAVVAANPTWNMARVQQEVRWHYQWMVLNDFLPTIVDAGVLADIAPHISKGTDILRDPPNIRFLHAKNQSFMPLEFSAAAYRFGHSMVRPGYRLNDAIGPLAIFDPNPFKALTGFREFPLSWALDWDRFIDIGPRPAGSTSDTDPANNQRLQLAYRIDTSLVNPLANLPPEIAGQLQISVLAERNLRRGWRMRLPSGQAVARAMGAVPLADADIKIGKFTGDPADIVGTPVGLDAVFADNCPLWTYVLAETIPTQVEVRVEGGTRSVETRKLGPVGGGIVAETFLFLIGSDRSSFLVQHPLWKPTMGSNGTFTLRDLVSVALTETIAP